MKQQGSAFKIVWPAFHAKPPANGLIWKGLHGGTGIRGEDDHMERRQALHMVAEQGTQKDL